MFWGVFFSILSKPTRRAYIVAGAGIQIVSNIISMSKRIRFGLNFLGPSPAKDGTFLSELGVRYIEGCDAGDKRYVLFSLDRAKKSTDVLQAIEDYNKKCPTSDLDEELLMASDGMLTSGSSAIVLLSCAQTLVSKSGKPPRPCKVAVFDKGHAFQSHEIFRVIHTAKLALNEVEAPPIPAELFVSPLPSSVRDQPSGYWSWGVAEETSGAKRAVAALVSDLVEQSIKPCASKRVSFAPPGRDEVAESGEEPTGVEDNLSADDAVVVEQQVCIGVTHSECIILTL